MLAKEKEEEEMVKVVEEGGKGDDEDFILREQVNSLKLQVRGAIKKQNFGTLSQRGGTRSCTGVPVR